MAVGLRMMHFSHSAVFSFVARVAQAIACVLTVGASTTNTSDVVHCPDTVVVQMSMFGRANNHKVFNTIVARVLVFVMNFLISAQTTLQLLLHNVTMLMHPSSVWSSNHYVPSLGLAASASVPSWVVFFPWHSGEITRSRTIYSLRSGLVSELFAAILAEGTYAWGILTGHDDLHSRCVKSRDVDASPAQLIGMCLL